jgi:hypothetical protein
VGPIQAAAASELTLAITGGSGTDSLWLWSSNNGGPENRPQLVLTYS